MERATGENVSVDELALLKMLSAASPSRAFSLRDWWSEEWMELATDGFGTVLARFEDFLKRDLRFDLDDFVGETSFECMTRELSSGGVLEE